MQTKLAQPKNEAAACEAGMKRDTSRVIRANSACPSFGCAASLSAGESNLAPPEVHRVLNSSGRPLPSFLADAFGLQFRDVRIHDDRQANASARAVNARAYTAGHHVVFAQGEFSPGSASGRSLLAHELAHVAQQDPAGHGATIPARLPISADDNAAELSARRAASAGVIDRSAAVVRAPFSVQRQEAPIEQRYNLTLTFPPFEPERYTNVSRDEALRVLRHFRDRISAAVEGGMEGHRMQAAIRNDQYIVGAISDFFGGVSLPPLSIWDEPRAELQRAQPALEGGNIAEAARHLQTAAVSARRCSRQVTDYREGTIAGAERSVVGLEVVEVASATIVSVGTGAALVEAGVAAGTAATASTVIGAGYTGTQRLAGEAMSVHLGLQDRIDWAGVAFDTLFAAIAGRFGGRLGAVIAERLGGRVAAQLVSNLIVGRASGLAHAASRELFDALRGRTELTVDGFIHRLAEQLTLRAVFLDMVATAAGMTTAALTAPQPATPSSGSGGGRSSGQDNVVDLAAYRARRQQAASSSGRTSTPRASSAQPAFEGTGALDMAAQPLPVETPVPQAAPTAAPAASPRSAASPGSTISPTTVPGAVAVAAGAGPASSSSSPPIQVRLELPPQKAIHANLYRSLVRARRLEHTPNLPRRTAQAGRWDRALRPPRGEMAIYEEIWRAFAAMGISEERRLRPNWSRTRDGVPMEVDHRVEWQLLGTADRTWGDSMANYELLDRLSNGSAGPALQQNIQRERARLANVTHNPAWRTQRIVFTELIAPGAGSSGAMRWLPEEIQQGDHYHALRELRGEPDH